MKKNRKRKTFGNPSHRPYDPQMIRDFIEQLKWGLRVSHFEHVSKRGPVNDAGYVDRPISPDLVEQLSKFVKKRGCLSLITRAVGNTQEAASLPPDDREHALDLLDALLGEMADRDLKMLEGLEPRFREALACASRPDQETCLQFSLSKVLETYGTSNGEHDAE